MWILVPPHSTEHSCHLYSKFLLSVAGLINHFRRIHKVCSLCKLCPCLNFLSFFVPHKTVIAIVCQRGCGNNNSSEVILYSSNLWDMEPGSLYRKQFRTLPGTNKHIASLFLRVPTHRMIMPVQYTLTYTADK